MFVFRPSPLITLSILSALVAAGCGSDTTSGEASGSLNLNLELAEGVTINQVDWTISGGDMEPMSGTIDTSAPGATASVEVFGLPPGDGYLVELEATDESGEITCKGSAEFSVEVGVSTDIMVFLNCKRPERLGGVRVNGKFNICADLAKVVVSPLQTSVGNDIDLSAIGQDAEGDAITYVWSATGGTIGDSNAQETTYTCGQAGEQSITISVSDDDFEYCMDEWTVPVTCVPGDGGDLCEGVDCDDQNECTADSCNPEDGSCSNTAVDDGTSCQEGAGECMSGECVVSDLCEGVDCSDDNECTADSCNPEDGSCSNTAVDDGTSCQEGAGECMSGECVVSDLCEGVDCSDDNECTADVCNLEDGSCSNPAVDDGTSCLDGTGMCVSGECMVSDLCEGVTCDPTGNECTFAECNNQTGECDVMNVPNGTECSDRSGACSNGRCIACVADSVGDPHLITLDRRHYDLQTVGEYILARTDSGGFEIQARTGPWRGSRVVSVNIAIAADVDGHAVSLYANDSNVFIDHQPIGLSGRYDFNEGGHVESIGAVTELVWSTGDLARITRREDYLDLHVELTAPRCGELAGLLGNGDGNPTNDLLPRDATNPLESPVSFDDLLNVFGNSWRITQEESLFDYTAGMGTSDFTDLSFPDSLITAADLTPEAREAAEMLCRELGLVNAVLLEACILDYGLTQDPSVLDVYRNLDPPLQTTAPWAPARVRVAHLAPGIPAAENTAVDIYIDGELSPIQGLTFGNSTRFIDLPPREYVFGIAPAGGASIFSMTVPLTRGQDTTVVAIRTVSNRGVQDPVDVLVFNDSLQASPQGFGRFAVGHGADDTSIMTVDGINTESCPPPVFANLAFGTVLGPGEFAVGVEPGAVAAPGGCEPLAGPWAAPTYPDTPSLAVAVDLDANDNSPNVVGYLLVGDSEGPIPTMPFLVEEPGPEGCDVGICLFDDGLRALCEASLTACLADIGDPSREDECFLGAPVICGANGG